ncbi:hypothetical protein [Rufibacter quisquiliarum]|uniref:Uncharacterized protein n=1 Tax=Rufibacter quisquiliarum TaxID=1549639 RepID=A0A839GF76_9BACT|nr:hypothetical protein [Rufibacter quisquiliarum]MBA9078284.1 hypothetical protein [Rufibacter quisquiliarum]
MPKFIQLPQQGSALPILLNIDNIYKVDFFNGPEKGGREILLRVWVNTPKAIDLITSRFASAEEGISTYWHLHALLHPHPITCSLN